MPGGFSDMNLIKIKKMGQEFRGHGEHQAGGEHELRIWQANSQKKGSVDNGVALVNECLRQKFNSSWQSKVNAKLSIKVQKFEDY